MSEIVIPCEVYSRVVGYLRPVQNWHRAKREEFKDRLEFDVSEHLEDGEESDD